MSITVTPAQSFLTVSGQDINLFPMPSEVTVAQAAKFLDTSEGYVNEMLRDGHIAFRLKNGERLVQWDSLREFGQERERKFKVLEALVHFSEEMGLYDD